jgi:hypothetical protein
MIRRLLEHEAPNEILEEAIQIPNDQNTISIANPQTIDNIEKSKSNNK